MIEYIKGELTELTPALATIETGGVGYGLNISLNTFSAIQGKKEVKLYVYEAIREDAHLLFGFVNKKEREMFLLLITVIHATRPASARLLRDAAGSPAGQGWTNCRPSKCLRAGWRPFPRSSGRS